MLPTGPKRYVTGQNKQQKKLQAKPRDSQQQRKRQRNLSSALESAVQQDGVADAALLSATTEVTPADAPPTAPKRGRQSKARGQQLSAVVAWIYVDKLVAFSPIEESWIKKGVYSDAGSAYIIGRVTRFGKEKGLLEIQWLDMQFQRQDEYAGLSVVQRGVQNYNNTMQSPSESAWRSLCQPDQNEIAVEEDTRDIKEVESEYQRYEPDVESPSTMQELKSIKNMKFDPCAQIERPVDLFQHDNSDTKTRVRMEYRHLFEHSASSSFFAYIPVYYWVEVLHQTNKAMHASEIEKRARPNKPFSLQELMKFLGILFFMKLVDKGEYVNY